MVLYVLRRGKAEAFGAPVDGSSRPKFRVDSGSTALRSGHALVKRKSPLRDELVRNGVLVNHTTDEDLLVFRRDHVFSSSSAAGDVINDGNLSAPEKWLNVETGASLKADLEAARGGGDAAQTSPAIVIRHTEFEIGKAYTRDMVAEAIGLPNDKRTGGAWLTGYSQWGDEIFIFCGVGIAGRTGHDYPNQWLGKELVWFGNAHSAADQPLIRKMISGDRPVHVFWRGGGRSPFTYAGRALALDVRHSSPVEVRWSFDASNDFATSQPRFHRGPAPYEGEISGSRSDGPTRLYLMRLTGAVGSLFPELPAGRQVVKVGISNETSRRLTQMNVGFPPGAQAAWVLVDWVEYPNGQAAFEAEGRILDNLRLTSRWIGGEFATVDESDLQDLLHSGSATTPRT